ncbi:HipA domain-containing protein (plasmid) [Myxococcus sp. MxC21-1]|uniref:HipA domain-containing protein n=1 Tax=Myxococcus sp. MxC21-1 TaxID=3041439 RepID=UPI00292D0EC7|nr:HipA domain-containing protein [Myxococcus sp. MxC21-1]WNZ66233.1 HipA domain-containing protein [Myxococcus sp. MxC21-1]
MLPLYRVDETGRLREAGFLHPLQDGGFAAPGAGGGNVRHATLPPFLADMLPSGFLGRSFSLRHPELMLPHRLFDWNADDQVLALAHGADCVGNCIVGPAAADEFSAMTPVATREQDYPRRAREVLLQGEDALVGGEQPKFTSFAGRHVLVKFTAADASAAARRWCDLLLCEELALTAIRAAGIPAAMARSLRLEDYQFLELERFDRVGEKGRRPLVSLRALCRAAAAGDEAWLSWSSASEFLVRRQLISRDDSLRIRWLDTFGELIGNSDRHFGNLSFFEDGPSCFRLAPAYDMLPMSFAPVRTSLVTRSFAPRPPLPLCYDVWADAATHALAYWRQLSSTAELGGELRALASSAGDAVAALRHDLSM